MHVIDVYRFLICVVVLYWKESRQGLTFRKGIINYHTLFLIGPGTKLPVGSTFEWKVSHECVIKYITASNGQEQQTFLIQYWKCTSPHGMSWVFVTCVAVRRCTPLSVPDNGWVKCDSAGDNYGATCEFRCLGGYELRGSAARVCQFNMEWSGLETTCVGMEHTLTADKQIHRLSKRKMLYFLYVLV